MRFKKYIFILILVLVTSCRQTDEGVKLLRIAYVMSAGGASHEGAVKFAELVEKRSSGKIKVRLYPNGQLGSERDIVEGLKLRASDMVIVGASMIGWYAPQYAFMEFPFLFRDYGHMDEILYGEIGREIEDFIYERNDIRMLSYFHRGPRYLTTTNKAIQSPSDLDGMKLRVPELPIYIDAWTVYGASPTPVSFVDMFMALKQGVVDGQENPLEVIYTNHLYETQKYVMNTEHMFGFYIVAVGRNFYDKFTSEEQKLLYDSLAEATDYQNGLVEKYEDLYKEHLREHGVQFVDVDRDAFEKLTYEKLLPMYENRFSPGLMDKIMSDK